MSELESAPLDQLHNNNDTHPLVPPSPELRSSDHLEHHHGDHGHDEHMEHMMQMVENVSEPSTIQHLIQSLRHKLKTLNGDETEEGLLRTSGEDHHHQHDQHHQHQEHDFGHLGEHNSDNNNSTASTDSAIFHEDTITLLASCVVMIILGLALRKLFLYLANVKQTKRRHRGAIRQFAEHMHVVTRTISNPITEDGGSKTGTPIPGSPIVARRQVQGVPSISLPGSPRLGRSPRVGPMALQTRQPLPPSPLVTYNRQTTETSFFKPSTHEMVHTGNADEGLTSTLTTQLDARRISRMQNYLNNQD